MNSINEAIEVMRRKKAEQHEMYAQLSREHADKAASDENQKRERENELKEREEALKNLAEQYDIEAILKKIATELNEIECREHFSQGALPEKIHEAGWSKAHTSSYGSEPLPYMFNYEGFKKNYTGELEEKAQYAIGFYRGTRTYYRNRPEGGHETMDRLSDFWPKICVRLQTYGGTIRLMVYGQGTGNHPIKGWSKIIEDAGVRDEATYSEMCDAILFLVTASSRRIPLFEEL